LCTPLDVLAYESEIPVANVGDYFVMFQSGAYGYSSSPLDFLSHPRPLQYLV
jgi:diaminopimelate decarboxylase